MAPFTMRCNSCGEFIYRSTKFNTRKEICYGENYLGIQIYRFYLDCPVCKNVISIKTDPKNLDYALEKGATRNFEPWKEAQIWNDFVSKMREQEEEFDPMKALENRTADSKREIEQMEILDELRTMNARHEKVSFDDVLNMVSNKVTPQEAKELEKEEKEKEEDEELIKKYFGKFEESEELDHYVKRIQDDESDDGEPPVSVDVQNMVQKEDKKIKPASLGVRVKKAPKKDSGKQKNFHNMNARTKLGVIGCGTMAKAIISGLEQSDHDLYLSVSSQTSFDKLKESFPAARITFSNQELQFSVKPFNLKDILEPLNCSDSNKVFVSVCAGVSRENLQKWIGSPNVVRAMPNTPCMIKEGMTAITSDAPMTDTVGKVIWIDEKHFDSVTALSGSMTDAALSLGLPRTTSHTLIAQTMKGTAGMVLNGAHPSFAKESVTTPGGCTIAGLLKMEEYGTRNALIKTVLEAAKSSKEMATVKQRSD
ncbi:hypothetical protein ROZALSC1DRAFT_27049 [Rozella allomycis CSF55]|uniref:NAD(P)-binding domain-containing protein n=1 Tax=Rozella allomycis (strain CSF55) TaxID=988480 RepID=A0A075AWZ5_ROZAC|nr:NAD(P)-binding domain-containing protein [Rozella allomycis CSF55]RKP21563.1 hypothetical protein ROZALSC1DRAFT_27049 [Rozella allomycis CSF55]|eukprot:EPZ34644.1 NAD(P)-binding domain-containing protein [Rozella allomycis CSF55]